MEDMRTMPHMRYLLTTVLLLSACAPAPQDIACADSELALRAALQRTASSRCPIQDVCPVVLDPDECIWNLDLATDCATVQRAVRLCRQAQD